MKKLISIFLSLLLLASCNSIHPTEGDAITTAAPDNVPPVTSAQVTEPPAETTMPETEAPAPPDPADSFNERIRGELTTITGYFPDTNIWAYEFASETCPGEVPSKDSFDHERGATASHYSEKYDVGYTIWAYEDIRILLIYVIEDDLYTLSYAELLEDSFTELKGRTLCSILNEDGRFGTFTYPEPQSSDGVLTMNLTEISRSAILKKFPEAEEISRIQNRIVGVFNDSFILLYYYYIDGTEYPCSVTISIPSFMASGTVTVTPGWPDDTSNLSSESMIYEHYSAGYNDNGDLILLNLNDGSEITVDKCVSGENLPISAYHVPRFWKFTEDGRLLYHVSGWEDYVGLGVYNIATGENHLYHCNAPVFAEGDIIYTETSIYAVRYALYRLILNGDSFTEEEIIFPEGLIDEEFWPNIKIIDSRRVALLFGDGTGQVKVVLTEIEENTAKVTNTFTIESKVTSPQYPHAFGDYLIILCERHAMADEYAFAISLNPAAEYNRQLRSSEYRIEGGIDDTKIWAHDFASVVCPGQVADADLFEHEKGAFNLEFSDKYGCQYVIWRYEDVRILLALVVEGDFYGKHTYILSYAALLDEYVWELRGREFCALLNEDGRFGTFTYPEPLESEGVDILNLTALCESALRERFPDARSFSLREQLVPDPDSETLICHYVRIEDGIGYSCQVNLSLEDRGILSVEDGAPPLPASEEPVSPDGYCVKYSEQGDLLLVSPQGDETTVTVKNDGNIQGYAAPQFFAFTEDGKMLYHVYGWEHYIGLGSYDIASGENCLYRCSRAVYAEKNVIYACSNYYENGEMALYRLTPDGNSFTEVRIDLPSISEETRELAEVKVLDSQHAILCYPNEKGNIVALMLLLGESSASVLESYELDSLAANPSRPFTAGEHILIPCTPTAMLDDYIYLLPLTPKN